MTVLKKTLTLAVILIVLLLAPGVQAAYDPGWIISYYQNQAWSGTPIVTNDQPYIKFATPNTIALYGYTSAVPDWPHSINGMYQDFTITADGYIDIPVADDYTFYTTSDDGVELFVNGVPIISNTGDHGPTVDHNVVHLPAGYQHVVLNYRENSYGDPTEEASNNAAIIYLEYEADSMPRAFVPGLHLSTTPAPEFPSSVLPVTFIIGFMGAVLLIRRMNTR